MKPQLTNQQPKYITVLPRTCQTHLADDFTKPTGYTNGK